MKTEAANKQPVIEGKQYKQFVKDLRDIMSHDKTHYTYENDNAEKSELPNGQRPSMGSRHATPREIAKSMLRELDEDVW